MVSLHGLEGLGFGVSFEDAAVKSLEINQHEIKHGRSGKIAAPCS